LCFKTILAGEGLGNLPGKVINKYSEEHKLQFSDAFFFFHFRGKWQLYATSSNKILQFLLLFRLERDASRVSLLGRTFVSHV